MNAATVTAGIIAYVTDVGGARIIAKALSEPFPNERGYTVPAE